MADSITWLYTMQHGKDLIYKPLIEGFLFVTTSFLKLWIDYRERIKKK